MLKFTKIMDPSNQYDQTEVEFTTHNLTLPEILEDFKCFLLASGYIINGDIVVQGEEDE